MTQRCFVVLLIFFFLFLRLPSLFEPYWYGDEAIYLTLGWLERLGFVVYRDFYDHKPPLILVISSLLPSILWAKVLISLLVAPTLYFFYHLALNWLARPISRLATFIFLFFVSIPLFEGNIYNSEILNVCLTVFSFYLFFVKRRQYWPYFILGIAFTNKFPALFDYLYLLAFALYSVPVLRSVKHVFSSGILFGVPTLIFGVYFLLNHAFWPFIRSAFLDNISYISSWDTGPSLAFRFAIIVLILISLLFASRHLASRHYFLLWFTGWFVVNLFASLLSSRPYPHYLLQIVPPLSLLISSVFPLRSKLYALLGTMALVLTWLTFNSYHFYRYPVYPYYRAFYTSLFSNNLSSFSDFFGPHTRKIHTMAADIQALSSPDSRLFVWGDWPQVYHLSGLVPASPYLTSFHVTSLHAGSQVMDRFHSHPPRIIALVSGSPPFDALYQFLKKFYRLEVATSDYEIYQAR